MEFLTEEHLRHAALTIAHIGFVSGLVGAIAFHLLIALAARAVRAVHLFGSRRLRISAARQRSALKAS